MKIKKVMLLNIISAGILLNVFGASDTQKGFLVKKDTLIAINTSVYLSFDTYDTRFKLWYNPYIIKQGKKIKISDYNYVNGSELSVKVSPNKRFVLFDEISKGFVYVSETDSVLEENYFCVVIDVDSVNIVYRSQSDCGGEWNDNNQLVSDENILFSSLSIVECQGRDNKNTNEKSSKCIQCLEFLKNNAINLSKENLLFFNDCGYYLEQGGKYQEAIVVLSEVIAKFPDRIPAYLNIADAYLGLNNAQKAKENYQKYIELMTKAGKQTKIPKRVIDRVK
jgi:hypothetical protein